MSLTPTERSRKFRSAHPGYDRPRACAFRRARRFALIAHFGGCCIKCGYGKCAASMVFHHRPGEVKSFSLHHGSMNHHSWDELVAEASKCDLLCLNCHGEVHNPELLIAQIPEVVPHQ